MPYEQLCKDGNKHNWGRTLHYGVNRTRCAKCGVDKPGAPLVFAEGNSTLSEDMNKMLDSLNVPKESDVPLGPGVDSKKSGAD